MLNIETISKREIKNGRVGNNQEFVCIWFKFEWKCKQRPSESQFLKKIEFSF